MDVSSRWVTKFGPRPPCAESCGMQHPQDRIASSTPHRRPPEVPSTLSAAPGPTREMPLPMAFEQVQTLALALV